MFRAGFLFMTQADIISRLAIGVARDDLTASYPDMINEARREIQRKRSWRCMFNISTFTILSGDNSVALPDNFKMLSNTRSPVNLIGTNLSPGLPNVLTPCDVWTRERVIRREGRILGNSILNPNRYERLSIPVYIDWQQGIPTMRIFYPATTDLPFDVSWYGYLDNWTTGTDTDALATEYPEMVLAKCKAVAFETINDPAAADFETLFAARFREASANDGYNAIAGMELRM